MTRNSARRPHFSRRTDPGASPGSLAVDPTARSPVMQVMAFDQQQLIEQQVSSPAEIVPFLTQWPVTWVNVDGLGDARILAELGEIFHLHPLALEDVVNVHQRAKVEEYHQHLFIVARMVELNRRLETEQLSLFLGRNFVLTFLQDPGDSFDPVRKRIRDGRGRIRVSGCGYLAYALLDAVVDAYFPVIEAYGDRLDELEDEVVLRPGQRSIARIHAAKRDLRVLRRAIWPLREEVNRLSRDASEFIDAETRVYLRDCYDHTVQIIDLVETYRELGSDLTDLYLSSLSNRMNEVMKVLTVIATIFMPLGFIAGVYGMNFDGKASPWNMPELSWPWGYPFALGIMALVALTMLAFFRRQGWLGAIYGNTPPREPEPDASPQRNS